MNKAELITCLRDPNRLSTEQLEELEAIVKEYPYFLSARLLLAKASKEQKHPKTKKRIASAAIYSTDRVLLKKYLNGNLFFLSQPPKVEEQEGLEEKTTSVQSGEEKVKILHKEAPASKPPSSKAIEDKPKPEEKVLPETSEKKSREDKRPAALKSKVQKPSPEIPEVPGGELDSILEELKRDMENLKSSRHKFAEVQQKIEEDDAVSKALQKASNKEEPAPREITKEESDVESKSDISADEAKKSASEITMQILDAAKKAKEEVAREEKEKEAKEKGELQTATDTTTSNDEIAKAPSPDPDDEVSNPSDEEKNDVKQKSPEAGKEEDTGRAERTIREPRFSRFASRSYLKPPEDIDPSSLLGEDDDKEAKSTNDKEEKKVKAKEEEVQKEKKPQNEDSTETEDSSKIKLPDLSKAKPVARRSKRKKKEESKTDVEVEDSKKTASQSDREKKEPQSTSEKSSASRKSKTPAEEKPEKKSTASATKKTTSKAATKTSVKKETEKKATAKKAVKTEEKAVKKTPAPKKTTAKKATTTKKTTAPKKTSAAKKTTAKTTTKKATRSTKTASKSKTDSKKADKKDDGKGDRKSQQEIIDKFIEESPSIKYQRTDDESSQDLAEVSSAWDPNLASEYLAEIYLHQGNKKRAIEIYEALSLKYPEKKSYFADLISKIE